VQPPHLCWPILITYLGLTSFENIANFMGII
jgi:hypothetical protein